MAQRDTASQLSSTDRWFYNATISNSGSGNVRPAEAKYEEVRTVPLIPDLSPFYVTLARMSVTGSTANFPICIPPLAGLTPDGTSPIMLTDLSVGVRMTVTDTATNTVVGYSEMNTMPLILPSAYPDYPRNDRDSAFYWVEYVSTLGEALNSAISAAFNQQYKFVPTGATVIPTIDASPFVPPTDSAGTTPTGAVATFEYLRATVDPDSYKLTLSAPYAVVTELSAAVPKDSILAIPNPFNGPSKPSNTSSNFAAFPTLRLQAHVFFNDKLLELFPMATVAPGVTWNPKIFPTPVNTNSDVAPNCSTNLAVGPTGLVPITWLDPDQTAIVTYGGLVAQRTALMYCIQTFPRSATVINSDTRATFGSASTGVTSQDGPWMFNVASLSWTQEYGATGSWAPITGIAITSSNIPVYEEAYGVNSIDPVTGMVDASSGKASSNIIFDIDLLQDTAHSVQGGVYYVPGAYRWAKCRPGALNTVDLRLLLRKRDGTFVPWVLDNGGTVNIKLMFCTDPY